MAGARAREAPVSAQPVEARDGGRPAETVAGFIAAAALAVGVIAIIYRPGPACRRRRWSSR